MSWLITLLLASSVFTADNGAAYSANQTFNNTEGKRVIVLDETERFEQTYPLNANGKVSVSNVNGSITVEAWDRNEVKLEVTKISDNKESLADVEIKIDAKAEYFNAETDYNNWNGQKNWGQNRRLEVQFRLTVPRTAFLDEIETVNGSVTVSNFTNYTKISAVNGSVKATNLRGTAKLSTVNGETIADFEQLRSTDKINLSTVNGTVNLTVPSDINATVKADTVNGSIKNDFGLPVRKGKYVGKDLYGKIGSGETEIKLNSVNGGLAIMRKADGRNPNPVINLLPQKSKDDDNEDWDDDEDDSEAVTQTDKMNRDIARSVKRSQAEVAKANAEASKAAAEAAKELARVQPIIDNMVIDSIIDSTNAVKVEIDENLKAKLKEKIKLNNDKLVRLRNADFFPGSPLIETKSDTIQVKGKPKVRIEAGNCNIIVRGWDSPEVKYEFTQISKNRQLFPVEVTSEKNNSDVFIKVKSTNENGVFVKNSILRLEVFVPKKSDLKIATGGEIRLENITGEIDLSAGQSSINVRDSDGKVVLNSTEGKIRVIGFKGDVQAKSVEGDIYLEGDFDKISAISSEGNIFLSLPEDSNAVFENDGEVNFEDFQSTKLSENKWRVGNGDGKYFFQTPTGSLTVRKSGSAIYSK